MRFQTRRFGVAAALAALFSFALTAQAADVTFTYSMDPASSAIVKVNGESFTSGGAVTVGTNITVTANAGYTISSVTANGEALTPTEGVYTYTVTGEETGNALVIAVTAAQKDVMVTVQSDHATLSASPAGTKHVGDSFDFTLTPATHYVVDNVTTNGSVMAADGECHYKYIFTGEEGTFAIVVNTKAQVAMTFPDSPVGVTVTDAPVTGTVLSGSNITFNAVLADGYTAGYRLDVAANGAALTDDGAGNYSYTVTGNETDYTLTFTVVATPVATVALTTSHTMVMPDGWEPGVLTAGTYKFTVAVDTDYLLTTVTANGTALTKDAEEKYSFTVTGTATQPTVDLQVIAKRLVSDVAIDATKSYSYTNIVVKGNLNGTGSKDIQITVKTADGTTVGTSIVKSGVAVGEFEQYIALTDEAAKKQTLIIETATLDGETPVANSGETLTYANVGWLEGLFGAEVESGVETVKNGTWSEDMEIDTEADAYSIQSTQTTFQVAKAATDKMNATHQLLTVECDMDIDGYFYYEELTNDFPASVGAIALATNEETGVCGWYVLTNGTGWVLAQADAQPADYVAQIELDFAAKRARYAVKGNGETEWSYLSVDNQEWLQLPESQTAITNVSFFGSMKLAKFEADLSTTALAVTNDVEFTDVLDAMAAVKDDDTKSFKLLTSVYIDQLALVSGVYKFDANGFSFSVIPRAGLAKFGKLVNASVEGDTITVAEFPFVAKIGTDAETALGYTALQGAFNEGGNTNIIVLTNIAESATSTQPNVTLDLAGWSITKGATAPILTVNGSTAKLTIIDTGAKGGAITGSTDAAAIKVMGGAALVIDGVFITNNTAAAINVVEGSKAIVSNGWFQGNAPVTTDDNTATRVDFVGGYYTDQGDAVTSTNLVITGGKFTDNSKTAYDSCKASGYKFSAFAVPVETNGVTLTYEVMQVITDPKTGKTIEAKVYSVGDDTGTNSIGGVQISDAFVVIATNGVKGLSTAADVQKELNKPASYGTGSQMKKWECYVLGVTNLTSTKEGPYVRGVQDAKPGKIGFSLLSPTTIKAAESGCDVKYEVEEFAAPTGGDAIRSSGKVNYDQNAELSIDSTAVRYYKLKVSITPKK